MNLRIETHSTPLGSPNGDLILQKDLPNGATLLLLADGMGGLSHPETAAKIICNGIAEYFEGADTDDRTEQIRKSIEHADRILAEYSKRKKCKMGVALLLVLICEGLLNYASIGDVRLYHRDLGGVATQLTHDDIIIQGGNSYLTACITGRGFRHSIEVRQMPLTAGDTLLLCSDGYYKGKVID